jgi:hypothetical protein
LQYAISTRGSTVILKGQVRMSKLATWILMRCAADYRSESFIGDLIEQYEERGDWWYWRQALGAVRTHSVRRLSTATNTNRQTAELLGDLIIGIAFIVFGSLQLAIYSRLIIGWTRLRSDLSSLIVVSTMIGAVLIGVAAAVHESRRRTARTT